MKNLQNISSQYREYDGYTRSLELGMMFSTLSDAGMSLQDLSDILENSDIIPVLSPRSNPILANSDMFSMFAVLVQIYPSVLDKVGFDEFREHGASGKTDWLVSWSIEALLYVMREENLDVHEALNLMPFENIVRRAVRYHTFPPNAFHEEVFAPMLSKERGGDR